MTTKLGNTSSVCRAVGAAVLVLGGLLPLSAEAQWVLVARHVVCLLYTSPSPRDYAASRMPSSA